jgi:vacuolar-type H+-ATPase subunit F/Vma7
VVALGEARAVSGLRLTGVRVCPAEGEADVRRAWSGLRDAGLVILTAAAAEVLGELRVATGAPLTVVMPP